MQSYQDLNVWKLSFELVKKVYRLTTQLPDSERFGLISQMQRCAVSIPSNIAEGQQRSSSKEFTHFLANSRGSAAELHTQLLVVQDIYKTDCAELLQRTTDIQKMLYSLQNKIGLK